MQSDVPVNCRLLPMGLGQLKELVVCRTGFNPHFSSPYKLCDFKPAFGEIFQDELTDYDYWGFTDIDLVLGDLQAFLSGLGEFDVFSTRKEFLSGPFFLMRNEEWINHLYRNSKDVQMVLESEQHYCFDECNFAWVELRDGRSILELDTHIESMTEVLAKAMNDGLSAHFETLSLEPRKAFDGRVEVARGKVTKDGKEFIHYHHHWNKGQPFYTFPGWHWHSVPERFEVTKYGVYSKDASVDYSCRFAQVANCYQRRFKKLFSGSGQDTNASKIS